MPKIKTPQTKRSAPTPQQSSQVQPFGTVPAHQLLRTASAGLMGGLVGVLIDAVTPGSAADQRPDSRPRR